MTALKNKPFAILLTILLFVMQIPSVYAQETNWEEVITHIAEANTTIPSLSGVGDVQISVVADDDPQFEGNYQLDYRYNVEPKFSGELTINGNSRYPVNEYDDNWNVVETKMQEEPTNYALTVIDSILYAFDGSNWTVEDISAIENEISEQYSEAIQEIKDTGQNQVSPELIAFYNKYYDLSENDTDYIFTLKDNINAEEFWNDLEASANISVDEKKQEAINQTVTQIEEQTEETMSQEERKQFEEVYNKLFDLALTFGQNITVSYDKTSYLISGLNMNLQITQEDINDLMGETTIGEDLGSLFIEVRMNLTFDNQGQTFDIQVPADAPAVNEASSTESTTTETMDEESSSSE